MSLPSPKAALLAMLTLLGASAAEARAQCPCTPGAYNQADAAPATQPIAGVLRVAADPNAMPYSNAQGEGFENRIAELIARDLSLRVEYRWLPQRLGYFRTLLKEGDAHLTMSVPVDFERTANTAAYYRSSYVFVSRAADRLTVNRLDDARLKSLRVGVLLTGESNSPPTQALARHGLISNLVGFPVYADGGVAKVVDAVARRDVDVAILWGPPAGYFAARQSVPLTVRAIEPDASLSQLPFAFDMSVGVRRSEAALRDRIDDVLKRRRGEIEQILNEYHVPHSVPLATTRPAREDD